MKLKSLLFGSAAALVAVTGAQAADMPMAEPVEYVRVCDAFGTGFFYIPGTDTCLKISGYVRAEWYWQDLDDGEDEADPSLTIKNVFNDDDSTDPGIVLNDIAFSNNSRDNFTSFVRGALQVDARKMTDIGLLRTAFQYFINVNAQFEASENNADGANLDFAFIQLSNDLGTLTVGHTSSFFNFKGSGTMEGTGANDPNTNLVGYAFNVGNGVSFSLAIEDSNSGGRNGGIVTSSKLLNDNGSITTCENYGALEDLYSSFTDGESAEVCFGDHDGDEIPDITGNIRLDQAWGSIQLMGVLHHVRGNASIVEISTEFIDGQTLFAESSNQAHYHDDEWGWAVGAGGEVASGAFSAFIQGFYGEGVGNYFWSPVSGAAVPEGQFDTSGSLDLADVWFVNGAVTAGLGSSLTAVIAGSYGEYDAPSPGGGVGATPAVPSYDEWAIAGDLLWNPTGGMTIGVGIVHWDNSITDEGTKGRVRFQSSF